MPVSPLQLRPSAATPTSGLQNEKSIAHSWRAPGPREAEQLDLLPTAWENPTMVVTLDAKRRLTVPAALAPAKPGDLFEVAFDPDEDAIVFRRLARDEDWLAILEKCPVPLDDLPPRRRETFRSKL